MRNRKIPLLAFSLLAICRTLCPAQPPAPSSAPDPISTDRPSVCTGPELVPIHALQFENGVAWTHTPATNPPTNAADFTQTEVRFGLSRRVELQAYLPDMHYPGAAPGLRLNDFAFGTKLMLIPKDRPWPLALDATLTLPTGASELTSSGVDPTLLLGAEHSLPHQLQLSGSANLTSLSASNGPRSIQSQLAFDLGWCTPSAKTCLYAEEAPFLGTAQDSSGTTSDGGLTLRLAPRIQLDSRIGTTIQSGVHTYFLTIGYSFRHDFR